MSTTQHDPASTTPQGFPTGPIKDDEQCNRFHRWIGMAFGPIRGVNSIAGGWAVVPVPLDENEPDCLDAVLHMGAGHMLGDRLGGSFQGAHHLTNLEWFVERLAERGTRARVYTPGRPSRGGRQPAPRVRVVRATADALPRDIEPFGPMPYPVLHSGPLLEGPAPYAPPRPRPADAATDDADAVQLEALRDELVRVEAVNRALVEERERLRAGADDDHAARLAMAGRPEATRAFAVAALEQDARDKGHVYKADRIVKLRAALETIAQV